MRNLLNAGSGRKNNITLPKIRIQERDDDDVVPMKRVTLWPAGQSEDGD